MINSVVELGEMVREVDSSLHFTMVEIGARILGDEVEPSHSLLDIFPNSRIIAFELNEDECIEMNKHAREGLTYYPVPLGKKKEQRTVYETVHPMCSSLYEPNEELMDYYNSLEVSYLKEKHSIETEALDTFLKQQGIKDIDFIKIDVQGAELDVFKGARKALKTSLLIVSEVEFFPLYKDQPLFGDVSKYLTSKGFMFHKFLDLSGRTLKPFVQNNNPFFTSQVMWSDAIFIRDITKYNALSSEALLKLSLLSYMYGSSDLTLYCLKLYDERENTDLINQCLNSQ